MDLCIKLDTMREQRRVKVVKTVELVIRKKVVIGLAS